MTSHRIYPIFLYNPFGFKTSKNQANNSNIDLTENIICFYYILLNYR